ncbi:hypothetical protein RDWZM_005994 [Blomia tropicalis]|uniref:Proteasome activator PA28 C-terminal domain-containing protein n=1 Tax=Blomia tropicalis TaxID=40697 RepID=A0A9Q0M8T0_BLOTA|nr:Proteasome activator complex subunit 3 [Blomia tropicalis]KAJ6220182.1 hypothetical protein RDWZM_005994 [Blomia tropicalis]
MGQCQLIDHTRLHVEMSSSFSGNVVSITRPSNRMESFFKEHLSHDIEHVRCNYSYVMSFHHSFVQSIDTILKQFIPNMVFYLKEYIKQELNDKKEVQMMNTVCADLERFFPILINNNEIDDLLRSYTNVEIGFDQMSSHPCLPLYHFKAIFLPDGMFPENVVFRKIYNDIRPKMEDICNQLWRLEYGICVLMPAMDDSNNIGVSVQREVRSWINSVWKCASELMIADGWQDYANSRIGYLRELFKYRQMVDVRQGYLQWERGYFRFVRHSLQSLWLNLLMLQHSTIQNVELVMRPRIDQMAKHSAKVLN